MYKFFAFAFFLDIVFIFSLIIRSLIIYPSSYTPNVLDYSSFYILVALLILFPVSVAAKRLHELGRLEGLGLFLKKITKFKPGVTQLVAVNDTPTQNEKGNRLPVLRYFNIFITLLLIVFLVSIFNIFKSFSNKFKGVQDENSYAYQEINRLNTEFSNYKKDAGKRLSDLETSINSLEESIAIKDFYEINEESYTRDGVYNDHYLFSHCCTQKMEGGIFSFSYDFLIYHKDESVDDLGTSSLMRFYAGEKIENFTVEERLSNFPGIPLVLINVSTSNQRHVDSLLIPYVYESDGKQLYYYYRLYDVRDDSLSYVIKDISLEDNKVIVVVEKYKRYGIQSVSAGSSIYTAVTLEDGSMDISEKEL